MVQALLLLSNELLARFFGCCPRSHPVSLLRRNKDATIMKTQLLGPPQFFIGRKQGRHDSINTENDCGGKKNIFLCFREEIRCMWVFPGRYSFSKIYTQWPRFPLHPSTLSHSVFPKPLWLIRQCGWPWEGPWHLETAEQESVYLVRTPKQNEISQKLWQVTKL